MERLTTRCAGHAVMAWEHEEQHTTQEWIDMLTDRLAAYEDSGLTPGDVKDMADNAETRILTWFEAKYGFPVGELMDLLEAKQDSRLVVLPCKVGDTIWRIKCSSEWPDIGKPYIEADAFLYRDIHYFGKTVFLTREEAEKALVEGGHI